MPRQAATIFLLQINGKHGFAIHYFNEKSLTRDRICKRLNHKDPKQRETKESVHKYFYKVWAIFSYSKYLPVQPKKWKSQKKKKIRIFSVIAWNNKYCWIIVCTSWVTLQWRTEVVSCKHIKKHRSDFCNYVIFQIIKIGSKSKQLLKQPGVNQLNKPESFSQLALIGLEQDRIDFPPTPPTPQTN